MKLAFVYPELNMELNFNKIIVKKIIRFEDDFLQA